MYGTTDHGLVLVLKIFFVVVLLNAILLAINFFICRNEPAQIKKLIDENKLWVLLAIAFVFGVIAVF